MNSYGLAIGRCVVNNNNDLNGASASIRQIVERLESLPPGKLAVVYDFVAYLVASQRAEQNQGSNLVPALESFISTIPDGSPREENRGFL